jgi:hypothetical protein
MAILILGKSICPLCNQVIKENDDIVMFSPFVSNKKDDLWFISDAVVHKNCRHKIPILERAINLHKEKEYSTLIENRLCNVCGEKVDNLEDYLTIGCISSDKDSDLYQFNFLNFHTSHVQYWKDLKKFLFLISKAKGEKKFENEILESFFISH